MGSDIFYICVSLYPAVTFNKEKCAKSTTNDASSFFTHGRALNEYLARAYPQATLRFDLTLSMETAMSRMITFKYLICGPGTVECLLPALS
eukprot:596793-Ditylum_brightwellii.AAC.1